MPWCINKFTDIYHIGRQEKRFKRFHLPFLRRNAKKYEEKDSGPQKPEGERTKEPGRESGTSRKRKQEKEPEAAKPRKAKKEKKNK